MIMFQRQWEDKPSFPQENSKLAISWETSGNWRNCYLFVKIAILSDNFYACVRLWLAIVWVIAETGMFSWILECILIYFLF